MNRLLGDRKFDLKTTPISKMTSISLRYGKWRKSYMSLVI